MVQQVAWKVDGRLPILILLLVVLLAPACRAAAEDTPSQLTLYLAQGADPNIYMISPEMLRGEPVMDDTYFAALGYFHPLATPTALQKLFDLLHVPNTRTGIEGQLGKHHGRQHNAEAGATWQLRFAPLHLPLLRVRPAAGIGLSYAIGDPAYEDGSRFDPEKRYHLLNFNIYELEWSLEKGAGHLPGDPHPSSFRDLGRHRPAPRRLQLPGRGAALQLLRKSRTGGQERFHATTRRRNEGQ
jgi:hypothetical protein